MPFQPGECGNQAGRPHGTKSVSSLAKSFSNDAVKTLAAISADTAAPAQARVDASKSILELGASKTAKPHKI